MRTLQNNGQATATKANNYETMPQGEYGDLCYDYFCKGSVIVFGNTDDHREQLERMGGKYSEALRYSPLQNGRKWTEKQGRTAGYYFTTEKGKEQAVKYVQRVNHSLFDKYEQAAATMGDRIQRREDLKEGDRVRTIHGLGTVTAHEPKYNKRVSVCVKLDKFTYNYGWQGMPHTFIECRCDEVALLQELSEIKAASKRDQTQTGLQSAERERAQLKVKAADIVSDQERTRLMFANGTKDNHAQGICINHKDGAKHLEEHRRLFHKSSKREVMAEGPDFITVRYLDYNSAYDNGVRTYYLEPAA